jgi:hypothetical protein
LLYFHDNSTDDEFNVTHYDAYAKQHRSATVAVAVVSNTTETIDRSMCDSKCPFG